MSRMIDADALKYAIVEEGQRSRRYKLGDFWELNGEEIRNVIDAQPTIEPEQQWIPVTERLPEPYTEVLAFVNDGSKYCEVLNYDTPGDGTYTLQFYRTDYDGYPTIYTEDVIAWMPLPKLWEGEE